MTDQNTPKRMDVEAVRDAKELLESIVQNYDEDGTFSIGRLPERWKGIAENGFIVDCRRVIKALDGLHKRR